MDFIMQNILSITIFAPLFGAAIILILVPKTANSLIKWVAALSSLVPLLCSVMILKQFNASITTPQFTEKVAWISAFNIEYFVAIDGISVTMVILTALLSFLCIFASWNIEHWKINRGIKGYFVLFLLLETGMIGVFCALDFFLFYVFWELVLLPMYFLIGIWGGPRKEYAAIKFFLYTLFGSVLMLIVMLALYFSTSRPYIVYGQTVYKHTFDLVWMAQNCNFDGAWWRIAFVALYIGFAIKVPVFPFHTWLPDAHVEAPTPISVILAGVLLKMGTYGLIRISYPILPDATRWFAPVMMIFGFINIVYGALCAMAQIRGVPRTDPKTGQQYIERDWKKLVAYSSVSHMGYCLLGFAACTNAGMQGAIFQMWNHGIITGALFLLVGVIYDRVHHRDVGGFGGLWAKMPYYGGITAVMFMASLGLPGLAGFIGEVLCFIGAFSASDVGAKYLFIDGAVYYKVFTALSVTGVVLGAAYFLWSYQKIFLGPVPEGKYHDLTDVNFRELAILMPLVIITVLLGIFPSMYLDLINTSVVQLVQRVSMPWISPISGF